MSPRARLVWSHVSFESVCVCFRCDQFVFLPVVFLVCSVCGVVGGTDAND